MTRLRTYITVAAAFGLISACGKPLETKEEFEAAAANAAVPTTAARTTGALMHLYASNIEMPEQLPQPFITVRGVEGGEATLSVNPVGLVVGLAGRGVLFDVEYDGYSVDGVNYLDGKVSVLANFEYTAEEGEDPNLDFQVAFVGRLELGGAIRDEARVNLTLKSNLDELMTRDHTTRLRINGKVTASQVEFEYADEDVEIDWAAQAASARDGS
ncbi:MAG: hypothetical protein IRZ16_07395 [Myxococcaceae bacterium]|nr:hypothetical protein [Myxococcaceae bacterium]